MDVDSLFAHNSLCKMPGIRYPVMRAGMYQVALGRLAADGVENGVLPEGRGSALIHAVKPAGQVVADIVAEARAILGRW